MSKFNWPKRVCAVFLLWAVATVATTAQSLTTLHGFGGTDGQGPLADLVQGSDGDLYGTTWLGGTGGNGTVFKITPNGTLTTLHSFNVTDGGPLTELVQGTNGKFYGTTSGGGNTGDYGTVFRITPDGTLTTLHSFDYTDGANPFGALVQATDGNFYGTTLGGGAAAYGTVFKMTPSGTLTTLHSFDDTDGDSPQAGLAQGVDGNLYGTTSFGGFHLVGTVFRITTSGTLRMLHSFDGTDGYEPEAGLVQGSDGNFYGTTYLGGANPPFNGTIFKITPTGMLTTLYSFCVLSGCPDGEYPEAALVEGSDGDFYGTTYEGGTSGDGTIFRISPSGSLTTLYSFCTQDGCADGEYPVAGLIQDTDGNFYGTTYAGGTSGGGTVFGLSVGLGSFVKTNPVSGNVGAAVTILGTNLTGATNVTFHGTPATFTVVSSSEITTTVPAGATNGLVKVVTPGGTLSSNVPFRVRP